MSLVIHTHFEFSIVVNYSLTNLLGKELSKPDIQYFKYFLVLLLVNGTSVRKVGAYVFSAQ